MVSPPAAFALFRVRAFLRPGWPITVDFAPEPNTRSYVRVTLVTPESLAGAQPPPAVMRSEIDHDGRGGRRVLTLNTDRLPTARDSARGPAVRIADYAVESYRLDDNGQIARARNGSLMAPVHVFGFGAGPAGLASFAEGRDRLSTEGRLLKASFTLTDYQSAGSVSIADVSLGPLTIHRPAAVNAAVTAKFSYVAKQDFYQVDADIWRECEGSSCAPGAPEQTFTARPNSAPDHITGAWKIRPDTAPGPYDLYVRAWLHCNGAPADAYHDCADESAWAYGHAGPIQVVP
jgi:hypothetical protein